MTDESRNPGMHVREGGRVDLWDGRKWLGLRILRRRENDVLGIDERGRWYGGVIGYGTWWSGPAEYAQSEAMQFDSKQGIWRDK